MLEITGLISGAVLIVATAAGIVGAFSTFVALPMFQGPGA